MWQTSCLSNMASFCSLLLFLAISKPLPTLSSDIILPPPKTTSQPEAAVILIQAPQVLPSQYLPLAKALQASSGYPLWVGIPEFDHDIVLDYTIGSGIDRVLGQIMSNKTIYLFFAAHSPAPSGSSLQDYLVKNVTLTQKTSGLIMLGSFLKRSYRGSPSFPIPTLTIGGELDGVCRITRIMEEFIHRISMASNRDEAIKKFPVVTVPGMTHLQFASGEPSQNIKEFDLKPEIEDSDAHQLVSRIAASFIGVTLGNETSLSYLESAVQNASKFFQPLVDAYMLEGSYQFKPPCGEDPPSSACQVGSAWTSGSMTVMAELKQVKLNDADGFHPASEILPAIHHPKIFNNCSFPDSSCVISLSSVSENIYYQDKTDSGLVPNSACEIRAKLKSRQSVMLAAGFKNVDFNVSDAGSRCKTINQLAYDWALNHSDSISRDRFEKFGIPIVMGEDKGCWHNGGLWIYLPMSYMYNNSTKEVLTVSSIQLKTDVTYPIGMFAGMHFCKLLSPAKAMEWIYVDGLRERYSLSGTRADLLSCGL